MIFRILETARMHSSGMCTARLLIVSQHALVRGVYPSMHCVGWVYPSMQWAGVCLAGGSKVSAWGDVCSGMWHTFPRTRSRHPSLPVKTLPSQTSFAGGNQYATVTDKKEVK